MKKSVFILILCACQAFSAGFSIKNLQEIPDYERLVFVGKNSEGKTFKAIIEYNTTNIKGEKMWIIDGTMPLPNAHIEETYHVLHKNLLIDYYIRTQTFDRGKYTMTGVFEDMDVYTGKDDDFIITTLQGLMYILRTFPFESNIGDISIRTAQQSENRMNFKVRNKGNKKIITPRYGEIDVYELELRLDIPFIGAFIPKIYFYFKNDKSKTLVSMKGNFGMMNQSMEFDLTEYHSENR